MRVYDTLSACGYVPALCIRACVCVTTDTHNKQAQQRTSKKGGMFHCVCVGHSNLAHIVRSVGVFMCVLCAREENIVQTKKKKKKGRKTN